MNTIWDDVERARMKKEDEFVARGFAPYAYLGRGHLRPDLVRRNLYE